MPFETTHSTAQLRDIFGAAYVQEQHADASHGSFLESTVEIDGTIRGLQLSMFDEVLKSLRRALSL